MSRQDPAAFFCAIDITVFACKRDGVVGSIDTHNDRLMAEAFWQNNRWIHVEFVAGAKDGTECKVVQWATPKLDIINIDMICSSKCITELYPRYLVHMKSTDIFAGRFIGGCCSVHAKMVANKDRAILTGKDSMCLFSTKALRGAGQNDIQHFVSGSEVVSVWVLL